MMTDAILEQWVAILLRTGVTVAAIVVLMGGIGYLAHHGYDQPSYRIFHAEPDSYRRIPAIVSAAAQLDWRAVIQFGLLLLIATPILRVALALLAFSMERDLIYVGVTAIVLAILIFSLMSH